MKRSSLRLLAASAGLAGLTYPDMALAQNAAPPEAAAGDGLQDIVVTAQRRSENLQNIAIAATALSSEDLAGKAVQRIGDLQFAAPSLSVTDAGLTQNVNIRGIGIASGSPNVANGVATYIDGVFQPPILTFSSFYDLQNVEVLRGPQGTLVGSNSTGGAIFINSQAPILGELSGFAKAGFGKYDAVSGQAAVNVPLGQTLALRIAGTYQRRDSFYNDIGPARTSPDRLDETAGRIMLRWEPGALRATAKVELIDRNTGGYAQRPIPGTPFSVNYPADIRTVQYNSPQRNYERGILSSLELRYELANGITVRSVSGYSNKRINNLYDFDFSSAAQQTRDQFVRERQWSQEVNLLSPTAGPFSWILGGYLQRNIIDVDIQDRAGVGIPTDPTDILISTRKWTLGAFAQGNYALGNGLELQVGGRYSSYSVDNGGSVIIGAGGPIFGASGLRVADLTNDHKDGRVTGKVALEWQVDPDNHLYVFAARGYKPGGANSATSEFDPETVMDYEAGWKSAFADNHVRTQLGAFYMRYHDFQFDFRDTSSGQTGVTNVANATIYGFEGQAQARFGGFAMDGGFAYVHSRIGRATLVNDQLLPPQPSYGPQCLRAGVPAGCFDYTPFQRPAGGGVNLLSPKWSYNAGIEYRFGLGGSTTLTPRLNYAYVGSQFANLFYSRSLAYLRGRGLLSALVTLEIDKTWTIEGYATNIADRNYVSGIVGNNQFFGAPRQYGVRVGVNF